MVPYPFINRIFREHVSALCTDTVFGVRKREDVPSSTYSQSVLFVNRVNTAILIRPKS